MRIAVAFFLPPPGKPADIGRLFRQSDRYGDELQYVHVHPANGLLLVTMFLRSLTREAALETAQSLCSEVTTQHLSPSWVLVEVAVDGQEGSVSQLL
ncbi:hypothetical protein [Streptomyces sp. NPDC088760]|uniref:hypothetical protein n=1 Tax=Streptomyces sp. NPDC088760 TaxID=3365890 RepID=UPI003830E59C